MNVPASDPADIETAARAHLVSGCEAEERHDWKDAVEHYTRALGVGSADPFVRYFGHNNRAYALLQLGRFEEARWHSTEAIRIDDGRHNGHKNLGLAYLALNRPREAVACFIAATVRCPEDDRALRHLDALLRSSPGLLDGAPELAERLEAIRLLSAAWSDVPVLQ